MEGKVFLVLYLAQRKCWPNGTANGDFLPCPLYLAPFDQSLYLIWWSSVICSLWYFFNLLIQAPFSYLFPWDGALCSSGWPLTDYVIESSFPSPPPKCWCCKFAWPLQVYLFSAGDQTQGFIHARQALANSATPSAVTKLLKFCISFRSQYSADYIGVIQ